MARDRSTTNLSNRTRIAEDLLRDYERSTRPMMSCTFLEVQNNMSTAFGHYFYYKGWNHKYPCTPASSGIICSQTFFGMFETFILKCYPHLVIYGLQIESSWLSRLNNNNLLFPLSPTSIFSPVFSFNAYLCCFCALLHRLHLGLPNYVSQ